MTGFGLRAGRAARIWRRSATRSARVYAIGIRAIRSAKGFAWHSTVGNLEVTKWRRPLDLDERNVMTFLLAHLAVGEQ
jgi:hypothetical protein